MAGVLPLLLCYASCPEAELVGGSDHYCVRNENNPPNEVRCWGKGPDGRLGQGSQNDIGSAPDTMGAYLPAIDFGNGAGMTRIHAGGHHTCGFRTSDGKVACWGRNNVGQLGRGDSENIGDQPGEMAALIAVPVPVTCTIMQLESYLVHNCILCSNGKVFCWGSNEYGEMALGGSSTVFTDDPTTFLGFSGGATWGANWPESNLGGGIMELMPGSHSYHTCAKATPTKYACWGRNSYGQLGTGDTTNVGTATNANVQRIAVPGGLTIKSGCSGAHYTCIIYGAAPGATPSDAVDYSTGLQEGTVECWGEGTYGRLGSDSTSDKHAPTGTPVNLAGSLGSLKVDKITCGHASTCVLDESGLKLACWGNNGDGRLGYDDTQNRGTGSPAMSTVPTVALGEEKVLQISLSSDGTCVSLPVGVKCWGNGRRLGTETNSNIGDGVAGHTTMAEIKVLEFSNDPPCEEELVVAANHACVRNRGGEVRCWGRGQSGTLGLGNEDDHGVGPDTMGAYLPAIDFGTYSMRGLVAGGHHVCGFKTSDGKVACWGLNNVGQLGKGDSHNIGDAQGEMAALIAVPVPVTCTIMQLESYYAHNCILCSNGKVYCWGSNEYGEMALGVSTVTSDKATFLGYSGNDMWGADWPESKLGGTVEALFPGTHSYHTCAKASSTDYACWGKNLYGQLGTGDITNVGTASNPTVQRIAVPNGLTIKSGCSGSHHTCIIYGAAPGQTPSDTVTYDTAMDGSVECWGFGSYGALGSDSTNDKHAPTGTPVNLAGSLGSSKVDKIRCGHVSTCVLDESGLKLACWGNNNDGRLGYDDQQDRGTGTPAMSTVPTVSLGQEKVLEFGLSGDGTCVSLPVGVKCWGNGRRLGTETNVNIGDGVGTSMADMKPIELTCSWGTSTTPADIVVPSGWKAEAHALPEHGDYILHLDQFSTYNTQLQNGSHGTADFWWVNRSMRGATVYDITPEQIASPPAPSIFPVNASFTLYCRGAASCDVFVFLYHDPPLSSATNGGLIALVDDGWEASSCAPTFKLHKNIGNDYDSCFYHMVAMRNTIGTGESVTVKMEERPGAFVMFAVVPKAVCGNTFNEEECSATHTEHGPVSTCAHVNGACIDNWCPRRLTTRPPDFTRPPTMACPAANAGL